MTFQRWNMPLALLSFALAVVLSSSPILAAHSRHACFDTEKLMKRFSKAFGEVIVGQGIVERRNLTQLLVSPETGTWTIVIHLAQRNKTCMVSNGTDWVFGVGPIKTIPIASQDCINPKQTELDLGLWYSQRERTLHLEHRLTGKQVERLLSLYNELKPKSSIVGDLILIFLERPGAPVLIAIFKNNCRVAGFSLTYMGYRWMIDQLEPEE